MYKNVKQIIKNYKTKKEINKLVKSIVNSYFNKCFNNIKRVEPKTIITLDIDNKLTDIQKEYNKIERPVERIDELLELIRIVWNKYPDLRLGQLILNSVKENELYYLEDRDLYEILKKKYINNDRSLKL